MLVWLFVDCYQPKQYRYYEAIYLEPAKSKTYLKISMGNFVRPIPERRTERDIYTGYVEAPEVLMVNPVDSRWREKNV